MKIAFVAVKKRTSEQDSKYPPLGLLSIASYLVSKKIIKKREVKIIDTFYEDPVKSLRHFNPDIIAFSTITPFYHLARDYAERVAKEFKNAKIVIGGFHISSVPKTLETPFQIGVFGEGEIAFAELVRLFKKRKKFKKEDLLKIKGTVFLDEKGNLFLAPKRSLVRPLDKLPPVDWTLLPKKRIAIDHTIYHEEKPIALKTTYIYTARGCPYQCPFCAYNVVWGQKVVRNFNPKYVGEELERLYKKFGIKGFRILDDTFGLSKKRIKELINELTKRKLLGKIYFFQVFIRADLVDRETSNLLKKLGVVSVFVGMESGSQKILDFLKNRTLTVSQIKKSVKLLGKDKINVSGSFMLFSPQETKGDLDKTIELIKWFANQNNALDITTCVTTPFPGTKLWQIAEKEKIVATNDLTWKKTGEVEDEEIKGVFFKNNLSLQECEQIWKKAKKISLKLEKERWPSLFKKTTKSKSLFCPIKDIFLYYRSKLKLKMIRSLE